MLEIRELTVETMFQVYTEYMSKDFPASELKPFSVLKQLTEDGFYEGYGVYEEEHLVAYALFVRGNLGRYVLLDYLAVCSQYRSQGYGSQMLPLLQEHMKKRYDGILGEVEDPQFGHDEEDTATRIRRMRYYQRYGFMVTGLYCTLFGERLSIIKWGHSEVEDSVIYESMDDIYQVMFNKKTYPGEVSLNYLEK